MDWQKRDQRVLRARYWRWIVCWSAVTILTMRPVNVGFNLCRLRSRGHAADHIHPNSFSALYIIIIIINDVLCGFDCDRHASIAKPGTCPTCRGRGPNQIMSVARLFFDSTAFPAVMNTGKGSTTVVMPFVIRQGHDFQWIGCQTSRDSLATAIDPRLHPSGRINRRKDLLLSGPSMVESIVAQVDLLASQLRPGKNKHVI